MNAQSRPEMYDHPARPGSTRAAQAFGDAVTLRLSSMKVGNPGTPK